MLIQTTLIYAGLLGLLLVILSFNVMQNWMRVTGKGQTSDQAMHRAERLLSSFAEYVPVGLILMTLIELKHAPAIALHILGIMLVIGRIMHAFGSNEIKGADIMRFLGAQLTFLMLAAASLACLFYFVATRA